MKPPNLLLLFLAALTHPLCGGQRDVVSGFVTADPAVPGDFLFSRAADRDPRMGLARSTSGDNPAAPSRATLEVERDDSPGSGILHGRILRRAPDEVVWPAGLHLSPDRFAGQRNALNPGYDPLAPFEVNAPADFDADGEPDESDAFPADPGESADHDADGTGDRADPDDDNDRVPDDYESANGLDPLANDASSDADGDGQTNREEYEAGTAARDGTSFFRIDRVSIPAAGRVELTWQGVPGRTYGIWRWNFREQTSEPLVSGISVSVHQPIRRIIPGLQLSDFFFLRAEPHP